MPASQAGLALAVAVLSATTASCSTLRPASCAGGQQAAVQEFVYFGADKPTGEVSSTDWAEFLATTVTPRFPAGLTTWQASGQWRSDGGDLVREPSYVLSLVRPPDAVSDTAVGEIVAAYKERFEQEAVLRVRSAACISL